MLELSISCNWRDGFPFDYRAAIEAGATRLMVWAVYNSRAGEHRAARTVSIMVTQPPLLVVVVSSRG